VAQPIPFTNNQASGVEPLAGGGVMSMNVVVDPSGAVTRRPGIRAYSEAPSTVVNSLGIEGLFCTDDGRLLAMSKGPGRALYEVENGAARQIATSLPGTLRPVFAQTDTMVAIAGGREILKYDRTDRTAQPLGGNPPMGSHVIAHASRLLANDLLVDKTAVRYSAPFVSGDDSGAEDWSFSGTGGFILATARPDNVVAIAENTNNVYVFGQGTTQIYGPDASAVYLPEATREFGCGAPYSVVKQDQTFGWLDQYLRFQLSDGRSYKDISEPIAKTLETVTNPSECFGYRVLSGNVDAVCWSFPTDSRTFVYQVGSGWGQWGGWDSAKANYTPFSVLSHHIRQDTSENIVGTVDGHIAELSWEALTDLGEPIRAHIETGYVSRGTDRPKHCQCVRMVFRRGQATGSTGPQAWLSYRDQPGPWEPPLAIDLGASGDTYPVLEFRSLGTYRRRQWRFEFTGTDELVLVSATEDFEVLEQ
jgi:hypothetical protein